MNRTRIFLFCIVMVLAFFGCDEKDKKKAESKTTGNPQKRTEKRSAIRDYLDIIATTNGYVMQDGRKLFLSREKQDATQLFMAQQDGSRVQLTNSKDPVRGYEVSPGERLVTFITSKGGNEQFDIYLLNVDTKKIRPLLKNSEIRYGNVTWINDGSFLYTSNEVNGKDFYIYRYDLNNRKQPSSLLVEKSGYNVVADVRDDGKRFLFYTYKGNNKTVPYEFRGGKRHRIRGAGKQRLYEPVGYIKGGILMRTNEKSNMEYLEIWKNGRKRPVNRDRKWSVKSVVIDRTNRSHAVFCQNREGFSDCRRFRVSSKKAPEKLLLGKGVVKLYQLRSEMLVYLPQLPDAVPRPTVFMMSGKTKTAFGYTDTNGIDVSGFVRPELRKTKSFDGTEIPYFLYIPKTGKKPYRTLIYYHGGPSSQFRPYFIRNFQYFISRGYMVVAPNVRGSAGYGQEFMDMDNYKKRLDSVKDGIAVLDDLIGQGLTKKGMITTKGGSYGGFMVVASMAKFPDYYECGVDNVGVVDFVNFLKNTKAYRRKLREVEYGPLSDEEFLKKISPVNMVSSITGELLVAHGENDPRVPVSDAHILVKNMKKYGKNVRTLFFPDEGHGYRKKKNMMKYYETYARFLKTCMNDKKK